MVTVKQLLRRKGEQHNVVYSLSPDQTVSEALQLMADRNIGAVLVMERNQLIGIFSERDYARRGRVTGEPCEDRPLREVMTKRVFFIHPEKTLDDCMFLMTGKHIRHLPVMEKQQPIGMITMRDVIKSIISEKENQIRELESYISGSYGGF
jgi:CBS domain-containing protein